MEETVWETYVVAKE